MNRPLSPETRQVQKYGLLASMLLAAAVLAVLAPAAPADAIKPVIALGPTTVVNGTAVISGTVGVPASTARLTINGHQVGIQAAGDFAATVALNGRSSLTIVITNLATGETATTNIPLTTDIVGPGGFIGPGVLAALEQAAVTVLKPAEGFRILDGLPLRIEGSVLSKESLASLTVNGIDVLGQVTDGRFGAHVPGTSREVSVTVIDRQGVSQTTVSPVEHVTTAPPAGGTPAVSSRSVAASQAIGVRIARVRYRLKGIRRTKQLRVLVTITDRRGLRIRGASVGVRSARARWIARNPKAKRTNQVGQTSFVLRAQNRAFGRRLRLVVVAKTPRAKTRKASAVRLPRLAKRPASQRK